MIESPDRKLSIAVAVGIDYPTTSQVTDEVAMLTWRLTFLLPAVLVASTGLSIAQPSQRTLLTDSLVTWELAATALGNPAEVTSGYGDAATSLAGGNVAYGSGIALKSGREWATWCCGYKGEVVWTGRVPSGVD
ncbi:MAG: hypothetical protein WDN04_23130 [Rhodospirillales bacterium]